MLRQNTVQKTSPRGGRRRTGRSWFCFNARQAKLLLLVRIVWLDLPGIHCNRTDVKKTLDLLQ